MPLGPLQVLIVEFEHTNFTGEVEAEIARLEESDAVRVLDLIVVAKDGDGEIVIEHRGEGSGPDADVMEVGNALPPGGAAAIAVLEHRGLMPLHAAIGRAGGREIISKWAAPEELEGLGVPLPAD